MNLKLLNRPPRAVLMLIAVLFSLPIFSASAQSFTYEGINYDISSETDKTVNVFDNPNATGDIVIPERVIYNDKEYTVTKVNYGAFQNCTGLTSIVMPSTVTLIDKRAFYGCTGLTSITMPNSVTSIGDEAFGYCTSLTSITLPNSVTSISNVLFYNCTSLESITLPNSVTSIGDNAFRDCRSLASITIPNSVTSIGTLAFCSCSSLTSITLSNSVVSIGSYAFSSCTNLTSITIPNSVTSIGEYMFYNCTSLASITIPSSVTSIGNATFAGCESLTSITIPNSVTSIGEHAFSGCKSLKSITIPNSVGSIGFYAFGNCASLQSINVESNNSYYSSLDGVLFNKNQTELIVFPCGKSGNYSIPNSVTSIGDNAFRDCRSLASITIPSSVTSIGNATFAGCESLTSITIPNSVTLIDDWAFYNCSSLTSITIPNSVTSIGYATFAGCESLTSITIPNSVTSIGQWAFNDCYNLSSITIPNSVTSIGEQAFSGCESLTSITIPNSVTSIGDYAFGFCTSLQSINVEPDNSYYSSLDGVLFNKNQTMLIVFPCGKSGQYSIPTTVNSIGDGAFYGCKELHHFTIPEFVALIGENAFANCEMELLILSKNCNYGVSAFGFMDSNSHIVAYESDAIKNAIATSNYSGTYTLLDSVTPGYVSDVTTTLCSASLKIEKNPFLESESEYEYELSVQNYSDAQVIGPDESGIYKITGLTPLHGYEVIVQYHNVNNPDDNGSFSQAISTKGFDITASYTSAQTAITFDEVKMLCPEDEMPTRYGVEFEGIENDFTGGVITFDNLTPDSTYRFRLYAYYGDSKYYKYIEAKTMALDSVTDVETEPATIVGYYDLMGNRYDEPRNGINIVLYSDGTTRKVYINTAY